ncbi:MAG TPA: hypothetical protein VJ725_13520 [Thermoanaerobaculia bacterium]|nr:hypothetical protein [Thermoanaerobaculia bacterium]
MDELHREKRGPAVLVQIEDRDNVGMIERCEGLRLAAETRQPIGVSLRLGREDFEGHQPVQTQVLGFPDLSHSATAKQRHDAEVSEVGASLHRRDLSSRRAEGWKARTRAAEFILSRQEMGDNHKTAGHGQ